MPLQNTNPTPSFGGLGLSDSPGIGGDSGTPRQPSAATVTAPAPTPTPVPTASAGPAVETGLAADCLPGGVLDTDLIRLFRSANLHQRGDNTCHA